MSSLFPLKAKCHRYVYVEVNPDLYRDDPEKFDLHVEAQASGLTHVSESEWVSCFVIGVTSTTDETKDYAGEKSVGSNVWMMCVRESGEFELRSPVHVKVDYSELNLLYRTKWQKL